jgi:hypothetical protein
LVKLWDYIGGQDSVVGIGTSYGLDERGVGLRVPVGSRIYSSTSSRPAPGAHAASYLMGAKDSFPGGKAAGA